MSMYISPEEEKKYFSGVISDVLSFAKDTFPLKSSHYVIKYDCFTILLGFNSNGKPYASFTHNDTIENVTRVLNSIMVTFDINPNGTVDVDDIIYTPKANMSAFNVFFNHLHKQSIEKRALEIKKPFLKRILSFAK